jgi:hypothetical protein
MGMKTRIGHLGEHMVYCIVSIAFDHTVVKYKSVMDPDLDSVDP